MSSYLKVSRPKVNRITLNCTKACALMAGCTENDGHLYLEGREIVLLARPKK